MPEAERFFAGSPASARAIVSSWPFNSDARNAETGDGDVLQFDPAAVLARVEEHGDLYAASLAEDQELPELN